MPQNAVLSLVVTESEFPASLTSVRKAGMTSQRCNGGPSTHYRSTTSEDVASAASHSPRSQHNASPNDAATVAAQRDSRLSSSLNGYRNGYRCRPTILKIRILPKMAHFRDPHRKPVAFSIMQRLFPAWQLKCAHFRTAIRYIGVFRLGLIKQLHEVSQLPKFCWIVRHI